MAYIPTPGRFCLIGWYKTERVSQRSTSLNIMKIFFFWFETHVFRFVGTREGPSVKTRGWFFKDFLDAEITPEVEVSFFISSIIFLLNFLVFRIGPRSLVFRLHPWVFHWRRLYETEHFLLYCFASIESMTLLIYVFWIEVFSCWIVKIVFFFLIHHLWCQLGILFLRSSFLIISFRSILWIFCSN